MRYDALMTLEKRYAALLEQKSLYEASTRRRAQSRKVLLPSTVVCPTVFPATNSTD
jgi:hypothetical protein